MNPSRRLSGRVALITGASSGIGRETAKQMAASGADVALVSRTEEKLVDVREEITRQYEGVSLIAIPTDVRDEAMVEQAVDQTIHELGSIDVVVNNAGILRGLGTDLADLASESYREMMETNIDGVFFVTRAVTPHLRKSQGNLIFVGSFAGRYPRRYNPIYAASKWWVRGFSYCMEAILGEDGVAVSVVNPGPVRTEFSDEGGEPWKERFDADEAITPGEVAEAIVFAAQQDRSTVSEINIHHRDKLSEF